MKGCDKRRQRQNTYKYTKVEGQTGHFENYGKSKFGFKLFQPKPLYSNELDTVLKYAYCICLSIRVWWIRGRSLATQLASSGFESDLATAEQPWTNCSP